MFFNQKSSSNKIFSVVIKLSLIIGFIFGSAANATFYHHKKSGLSIGDYVWLDTNKDGIQDSNEVGAEGVKLFLYDCYRHRWIKSTVTDADGLYEFSKLRHGKYSVTVLPEFENPDYAGALFSPADATDYKLDSDAKNIGNSNHYGIYGSTGCYKVKSSSTSWDFGFYIPTGPKATDDKFKRLVGATFDGADLTANDDLGVTTCATGTTAALLEGDLPTGVTLNEDGTLSGSASEIGVYTAKYGLTDCNGDTSSAYVELTVTDNFEYCAVSAEAGDFNKIGGGQSLYIPGISTNLQFDPEALVSVELPNGDLSVVGTATDGVNTFEIDFTFSDSFLNASNPHLDLDSAAYVPNGPIDPSTWTYYASVTGTMTGVGGNFDGVVLVPSIEYSQAQIGVGANGKNTDLGFSGWLVFTQQMSSTKSKYSKYHKTKKYHGDIYLDLKDCGFTGSWSGTVLEDTSGDGDGDSPISVPVDLTIFTNPTGSCLIADGVEVDTTTTAADGSYSFSDLPIGDYVVYETQPDGFSDVSEVEGGSDNDGACAEVNAIAGTITRDEDDNGNDFVESKDPVLGMLSGRVLEDTDNDDQGDTGIPGVTLSLYAVTTNTDCSLTGTPVTTDSGPEGAYVFNDLTPGNYIVVESQPAGFVDVTEIDGGVDGDGFACDTLGDDVITGVVSDGENDAGNDFIERKEVIIGSATGTVTANIYRSGTVTNEVIPSPVTLTIYNYDDFNNACTLPTPAPTPVATTETDLATGFYEFTDLVGGSYIILETQPALYEEESEVDGGDDADSVNCNDVTNAITLVIDTQGEVDSGNNFIEKSEVTALNDSFPPAVGRPRVVGNVLVNDLTVNDSAFLDSCELSFVGTPDPDFFIDGYEFILEDANGLFKGDVRSQAGFQFTFEYRIVCPTGAEDVGRVAVIDNG